MRLVFGRAALVASLLLVLASAPLAAAQDGATVEQARAHFETGTRAFDTGDYELAVSEFQRAHALTGHPDLLFNIYSSAERAGRLELAVSSLEGFLAEGQVEPERRPVLEERLSRLRERLAAQAAPEPEPELEPHPEPEPEPIVQPESSADPSGVHPAGVGVLIGAGALALSFGVLAALSEVEDSNLASGCGATRSCTGDQVATLNALNIAADVSWIGAAALAVTGAVLLFVLPPEASEPGVALAPWATPDAAGLAARGRF